MRQVELAGFAQYEGELMKSGKITHTTLLVLDDCNTLTFAAAVDPLRAANRQAGRILFDWQFATPGAAPVTLTSGVTIPAAPLQKVTRTDLLIIVAGFDLEAQSTPALTASLRRLDGQGSVIAGIDGGPWVMAMAGLLDHHRATTHWEDLERFTERFPLIDVANSRFEISGSRLTCAGAAPAIEMMLDLIGRQHGTTLAQRIAGTFIYDPAPPRPQSRGIDPRHNAVTAKAQQLMEAALDDPLPVAQLAKRLGLSQRALQLQFQNRLGRSPQAHYLHLRLSEAERLVRQTHLSLQNVALATGFASQASFARAFRAQFAMSATQMRQGQSRESLA
ncbi:GlxA family transcriptional regulator [Sulfitobacter mediterraneus]|uniref:GlxA family transcriptional regulator n=2 Tax=Sulfitobacter mediterraneus TaxID=83219 RepID=UPI001EEE604A|nr:GlxA family transcriptional regulator [Sulfitobacter mediterraneus]